MGLLSRLSGSFAFAIGFGVAAFGAAEAQVMRVPLGSGLALAVFVAVAFGATRIAVDSSWSKPIREALGLLPVVGPSLYRMDEHRRGIAGLFTCPLCTGTWIGLLLSGAGLRIWDRAMGLDHALHGLLGGAAACAAYAAVDFLEARFGERYAVEQPTPPAASP